MHASDKFNIRSEINSFSINFCVCRDYVKCAIILYTINPAEFGVGGKRQFLAAMSSSISDVVTESVRSFVQKKLKLNKIKIKVHRFFTIR